MASLRKRFSAAWSALKGSGPRATAYGGASANRLTADWIMAATRSPDQEVRGDLIALKNRARDLARNNPHAHRFRRVLSSNVVGPHGIRLQSKAKGPDGTPDRETNRAIEAAWRKWGMKGNCTADGRLSFAEVQRLYLETWAVDGEALLRLLPGFDNEFGFAVQLLDTDQLDSEYSRAPGEGTNEIRMGVEIDRWGRPVAYHLWDGHPTEYGRRNTKRIRVPAEQIVHDFTADRAGQTRGVTMFAPVLFRAKMLDGYEEAVVVAARTGATNMGFFVPDPEMHQVDVDGEEEIPFEAEPGTFKRLPAGMTFEAYNPTQPTTSFSEFDKAMLRSISSGLDVGYTSLAGDLSDVNYSSIRQGKLDERDVFRVFQTSLAGGLLERVFGEWSTWAVTSGQIPITALKSPSWRDHLWQSRGWDWVDPLKDIVAADTSVALGVNSRTRICAERGMDFEDVLEELAEERRLAERYGVPLGTTAKTKASDALNTNDPEDKEAAALFGLIETRMNGNGHHATNGNGKG